MKKSNLIVGGVLVAFIIPVGILAAGQGSVSGTNPGQGQGIQDQTQDRIQDPTSHDGTEPDQTRDQDRTRLYTSTTSAGTSTGAANQARTQYQGGTNSGTIDEQGRTMSQFRLQVDPEHLEFRAGSSIGLGQMIRERERELAQETASSTSAYRAIIQNTNQVRLAVHALLAAQDLLGPGIGQQVSQIATQINSSVQTTANAELQIQTRGFWTRLLFGGNTQEARTLAQTVAQTQEQIQQVTQLLSQASTTPEVRAQLQTQLQAMEQQQLRLQQLADKEMGTWGIFSWRF